MKRLWVLCVFFSFTSVMLGQELRVTDFHADPMMNDAVKAPQKDANGVPCGLVKLGLVVPDATFEGDIISTKYANGEWLIYMMKDANWITVKTQQYLPLRYDFPLACPSIKSNVTYIMVVEVPSNDSTDYYLELAAGAAGKNNMEGLIQYIEKVPRTSVPDSLLALYDNALLVKTHNTLINSLKQRTNNLTVILDEETFKLCQSYIRKYPNSEYYKKVSKLLKANWEKFKKNPSKNPPMNPPKSLESHDGNTDIPKSPKRNEPFLKIGLGADPFFVFPDSSKITYDTSKTYYGVGADAVLRIGRQDNVINGLLGVGATIGSFINPNLHATAEIRLKVETLYLGVGADISLMEIDTASNNNKTVKKVSASPCYKFMVGISKERYDIFIGIRYIRSLGTNVGVGFKWYLF